MKTFVALVAVAIAGGTLGAAVGAVNDAPPPRKRK